MIRIIVDDAIPFLENRFDSRFDITIKPGAEINSEDAATSDALLIRTRTRCNENLLRDSRLKLIATATIGFDHIDTEAARRHGIYATNSPGCNAPAVAQYVWASLLRLGFDPSRHTLGVIGEGNVGSIVTDWGRRLGAKILVCDPPKADRGEKGEFTSLENLLANADAVTIHTPLTSDGLYPSRNMIRAKQLALMKPGALLINAARGGIVDEEALKPLVREGKLRAVIDTWATEPTPDPELLHLASFATPHIAGYSLEGKQRATRMVLEAVNRCFGTDISTEGLAPAYVSPADLSAEKIIDSYDPAADTLLLRNDPDRLDWLRDNYTLRREI